MSEPKTAEDHNREIAPQGKTHFTGTVQPGYGCICPPGANLTCQSLMCPRKLIDPRSRS